jgi:hypothetical protein
MGCPSFCDNCRTSFLNRRPILASLNGKRLTPARLLRCQSRPQQHFYYCLFKTNNGLLAIAICGHFISRSALNQGSQIPPDLWVIERLDERDHDGLSRRTLRIAVFATASERNNVTAYAVFHATHAGRPALPSRSARRFALVNEGAYQDYLLGRHHVASHSAKRSCCWSRRLLLIRRTHMPGPPSLESTRC